MDTAHRPDADIAKGEMLQVLLTGSHGFLGSYVSAEFDSLIQDQNRIDLTRWSRTEHGDLLAPGVAETVIGRLRPQVVLHFAWCSTRSRNYRFAPDNRLWTRATLDLLSSTHKHGGWFIGVGSGIENSSDTETDDYRLSKLSIRDEVLQRQNFMPCTWLQPHWVFSRLNQRPAVVRQCEAMLSKGLVFTPTHPNHALDFVAVEDVASAVVALVQNGSLGVIPIGSGHLRTVNTLLTALFDDYQTTRETNGLSPVFKEDPADITHLRAIGWRPRLTDRFFAKQATGGP